MRYKLIVFLILFLKFFIKLGAYTSWSDFSDTDEEWESLIHEKRSLKDYPIAGPIVPPGDEIKLNNPQL